MSLASLAFAPTPPLPSPEPDYFGRLPCQAWSDPYLTWAAKLTLGGLCCLAGGKAQFSATNAEIARAAAISDSTVRRGLRELESRGYLSRDSIGPRFSFRFTLRGGIRAVLTLPDRPSATPLDRPGQAGGGGLTRPGGVVSPDHPRAVPSFLKGFKETTTDIAPALACEATTAEPWSSSSLQIAPESTQEPEPESAKLVDSAEELFGKGMERRVQDVIAHYGLILVAMALAVVRKRNARPGSKPVESWGFVLSTLAKMRLEGPAPDRIALGSGPPVATILERLKALGWILRLDGRGGVERVRSPSASDWDKLPSDLLAAVEARKGELRAVVLRGEP